LKQHALIRHYKTAENRQVNSLSMGPEAQRVYRKENLHNNTVRIG